MTIEEKLSRTLNDGLAGIDVPPGDLPAVRAQGLRLRRNRRLLGSGIALTLVLGGSALYAATRVGGDDRGLDPVGSGGTWQSIEPAPVSPRWDVAVRLDRNRGAVHRRRDQHALSAQRRLRPARRVREGRGGVQPDDPSVAGDRGGAGSHALLLPKRDGRGHLRGLRRRSLVRLRRRRRRLAHPASAAVDRAGPRIPQRGRRQGLRAGQSWGGPGARRRAGHVVSPAGQRPATSAHAAHRRRRR